MTAPTTPAKQSERVGGEEMEMATIGSTPVQDHAAVSVIAPPIRRDMRTVASYSGAALIEHWP